MVTYYKIVQNRDGYLMAGIEGNIGVSYGRDDAAVQPMVERRKGWGPYAAFARMRDLEQFRCDYPGWHALDLEVRECTGDVSDDVDQWRINICDGRTRTLEHAKQPRGKVLLDRFQLGRRLSNEDIARILEAEESSCDE